MKEPISKKNISSNFRSNVAELSTQLLHRQHKYSFTIIIRTITGSYIGKQLLYFKILRARLYPINKCAMLFLKNYRSIRKAIAVQLFADPVHAPVISKETSAISSSL